MENKNTIDKKGVGRIQLQKIGDGNNSRKLLSLMQRLHLGVANSETNCYENGSLNFTTK